MAESTQQPAVTIQSCLESLCDAMKSLAALNEKIIEFKEPETHLFCDAEKAVDDIIMQFEDVKFEMDQKLLNLETCLTERLIIHERTPYSYLGHDTIAEQMRSRMRIELQYINSLRHQFSFQNDFVSPNILTGHRFKSSFLGKANDAFDAE
jgi:hypothetical protein